MHTDIFDGHPIPGQRFWPLQRVPTPLARRCKDVIVLGRYPQLVKQSGACCGLKRPGQ
jgi:hypothetical protein